MSIKNERDFDTANIPNKEQRDRDIYALSAISLKFDSSTMSFILTGSYAIEALTGERLQHGDMDANIFTTDIARSIESSDILIKELVLPDVRFYLYKKTTDRLEYDLLPTLKGVDLRRLEIQFSEVKRSSKYQQTEFDLNMGGNRSAKVPIVTAKLNDSKGTSFVFRVKSLSYVIATWAIRISGVAKDPKRLVRQYDVDLFKLLLASGSNHDDIILKMRHHPQMPDEINEEQVFQRAMEVLNGEPWENRNLTP